MNDDPLENDGSSLEQPVAIPVAVPVAEPGAPAPQNGRHLPHLPKYMLLATAIIVALALIGTGTYVFVKKSSKKAAPTTVTINTQSLDNGTLNKLTVQTGTNETKQQLTISPDTLFENTVEVQNTLKADKDLEVGGSLNVKGSTTLQGAVGINSNLAVRGALSVGGSLSAASLNVGSLVVTNVNASGTITFAGHIVPNGASPGTKASVAAAGGTVTVSGNDTAGTVTIVTGNGSQLAGEMAIISFRTPFATTPKVQLTPITSSTSGLSYYATRTTTFFTIDVSSVPAAGTTYVFDYLVTQ